MTATVERGVTATELRTIAMIADGLTVAQIGARLGLRPNAVSMRLARAAAALGTQTHAQTAVECVRRGLLPGRPRTNAVRRELFERHASWCALLRLPVCNCEQTKAAVTAQPSEEYL